jgi:DNA-binding transcriptional regulator/RsmH inhibitor MraZ
MKKIPSQTVSPDQLLKLTGIWYMAADEKGRFLVPAALNEGLNQAKDLVAIKLGDKSAAMLIESNLLTGLLKRKQEFVPIVAKYSYPLRIDAAHRISLPLDFQKVTFGESLSGREIIVAGCSNHIEVWPKVIWEKEENLRAQKELAEALPKILSPSNES